MPVDTVVFVPGVCGSILRQGDATIWPGTPANRVFSSYPDAFVDILSTSETITAPDVLRSVPLTVLGRTISHFGVYGDVLSLLQRQLECSEQAGTLIPFAYDWRRDIRISAALLHARLSRNDLKGKRVGIVAHSMGGLVARYALEKLGIPAGLHLEALALVATPHLGAPAALQNIVGLRPEIFLSARQCRAVLNNPMFPSGYQLLPSPGIPALLAPSPAIGFKVLDAFDTTVATQLGLSGDSLVAAQALSADLPFMGPGFEPPCPYIAIAGNAQKTIVSNYRIGQSVTPVEQPESGDGTVPLWSAAPPGVPVRYVAAAHLDACATPDTIAALRAIFRPDLPGGRLFTAGTAAASFSLQPLKTSVSPAESFEVAIVASRPTHEVVVRVVLTTVFDGDRTDIELVPIEYRGGSLRSIPLEFKAPDERAVLLFALQDTAGVPIAKEASVLVVS